MSAPPLIRGHGTPEASWAGWDATFEPFCLDGCARLVVVAPHPDDEVLGVGGLMALAAGRGVQVEVVAVSDGEASHPLSPTLSRANLAMLRPAESEAALGDLGMHTPPWRLRVPDGQISAHQDQVTRAVERIVARPRRNAQAHQPAAEPGEAGATWVMATWRGDGHPDHEAVGRASAAACQASGARLVEHPVWTWHWATPADPRVPWQRARALALPEHVRRAKREAVSRFVTQVAPLSDHPADAAVLPPHVLARLLRDHETLFV